MPARKLILTVALLTLAVPATSHAKPKYTAQRVVEANITVRKASTSCPNADLMPNARNLDAVRLAIVCLHNQIRAERGLPLLQGNSRLRRAAEGHSAEMVSERFFQHTSPSGADMVDRILDAGYVRADRGWLLGENLEWGTGSLATPRGAVDAWMRSPGHRANVLKRGFRHLGVGISLGTPTAGPGKGVTITVDFGARR